MVFCFASYEAKQKTLKKLKTKECAGGVNVKKRDVELTKDMEWTAVAVFL